MNNEYKIELFITKKIISHFKLALQKYYWFTKLFNLSLYIPPTVQKFPYIGCVATVRPLESFVVFVSNDSLLFVAYSTSGKFSKGLDNESLKFWEFLFSFLANCSCFGFSSETEL